MLIDWFTVAAQMVNFAVLLLLLKWLLFDRIVRAMDEREGRIADRLEEAEVSQQKAEERAAEVERSREQLEARRQELIEEAEAAAADRREKLTQQARREVDELRERWREGLEDQQREVVAEFNRRAGQLFERCVGRALKSLADTDLQQAAERAFLRRMDGLDEDQRNEFLQDDQKAQSAVTVTSAEELSNETRHQIEEVIGKTFGDKVEIEYEVSADLISGFEVRSDGRALGWNLRDYLESFSESLTDALREQTHASASHQE